VNVMITNTWILTY